MDARNHLFRQRSRPPPRQDQQDGMVGARHNLGSQDRHVEDHAGEQQVERSGWGDEEYGGEDDV